MKVRRPLWIPEQETYCRECHRMVAAHSDGSPLPHYRFSMNRYTDRFGQQRNFFRCAGWHGHLSMTNGMEDPAVAFTPTEPDTYHETEAAPKPPAVSVNSAPGPRARWFVGMWTT